MEMLNGRSVGLRTWLSGRARDKEPKDVTELLLFLFCKVESVTYNFL